MREFIGRKSAEDNLIVSRLPEFTEEEKIMINGSSDFLGFNHYTTSLVVPAALNERSWYSDQDVNSFQDPSWPGISKFL